MKNADAILTADWHIRGTKPVCRTDDFIKAQSKKLYFIMDLAQAHECPILIAGDLGLTPMWGDELINWFLDRTLHYNIPIIVTPGQHDLPYHNLKKWEQAALGILEKKSENFEVMSYKNISDEMLLDWRVVTFHNRNHTLFTFPYGVPIRNISKKDYEIEGRQIALMHRMVIRSQNKKLWESQKAHSAKWFLKKNSHFDLIVSGDNHQSFAIEHDGRWLVNPGSLMRTTAGQIGHKPSVYLWYAKTNEVERVKLPIEQGVIDREHIDIKDSRDKRIEAYIDTMKEYQELGLSFDNNMSEFLKANKPHKKVKQKIREAMV